MNVPQDEGRDDSADKWDREQKHEPAGTCKIPFGLVCTGMHSAAEDNTLRMQRVSPPRALRAGAREPTRARS